MKKFLSALVLFLVAFTALTPASATAQCQTNPLFALSTVVEAVHNSISVLDRSLIDFSMPVPSVRTAPINFGNLLRTDPTMGWNPSGGTGPIELGDGDFIDAWAVTTGVSCEGTLTCYVNIKHIRPPSFPPPLNIISETTTPLTITTSSGPPPSSGATWNGSAYLDLFTMDDDLQVGDLYLCCIVVECSSPKHIWSTCQTYVYNG